MDLGLSASGIVYRFDSGTAYGYSGRIIKNILHHQIHGNRAVSRSTDIDRHIVFGRSSQQSNTFRFKKQWGAESQPAVWQYYDRKGGISEMRPESGKYRLMIKTWQRLPVWLTRRIGPPIVRGIP